MADKKEFLPTEVYNEATGKWEKQKVQGVSEEIIDFMNHSRWTEEAQWKRDHYYQETKKEGEMPDEKRFAFDVKRLPKNVSLESIMDAGGEGNLPYEPDFSENLVKSMEEVEKLQFLMLALKDLTGEEQDLYQHLFVENISEREYERRFGVPRKTIAYRKQKMLDRLRDVINKNMK